LRIVPKPIQPRLLAASQCRPLFEYSGEDDRLFRLNVTDYSG
jgi:hypothetical protein